jgi:hypothetical protein
MAEFFGKDRQQAPNLTEDIYRNWNNAINKGNMPKPRSRPHPWNASGMDFNYCGGYSNCCGLAATGDEASNAAPSPVDSTPVRNLQAWQYAKTALAIVGTYVIVKFLYGKYVK